MCVKRTINWYICVVFGLVVNFYSRKLVYVARVVDFVILVLSLLHFVKASSISVFVLHSKILLRLMCQKRVGEKFKIQFNDFYGFFSISV